jgi:hypothetical protein
MISVTFPLNTCHFFWSTSRVNGKIRSRTWMRPTRSVYLGCLEIVARILCSYTYLPTGSQIWLHGGLARGLLLGYNFTKDHTLSNIKFVLQLYVYWLRLSFNIFRRLSPKDYCTSTMFNWICSGIIMQTFSERAGWWTENKMQGKYWAVSEKNVSTSEVSGRASYLSEI